MRNSLYRSRQARYVVGDELKQLLNSDTPVMRDPLFGAKVSTKRLEKVSDLKEYLEAESKRRLSKKPDISVSSLLYSTQLLIAQSSF
jgi:hypothetical protein